MLEIPLRNGTSVLFKHKDVPSCYRFLFYFNDPETDIRFGNGTFVYLTVVYRIPVFSAEV